MGPCYPMGGVYILFESASGYGLFQCSGVDEMSLAAAAVQDSLGEVARLSKVVSLEAFKPFTSAAEALEQINALSESQAPEALITFLQLNLPKVKPGKKAKYVVGVADPKLGSALQEVGIPCVSNDSVNEVTRGI